MKMLKQWFGKFLKDIEKANEKSFGDKKLDCCGLNSDKPKKAINNKK